MNKLVSKETSLTQIFDTAYISPHNLRLKLALEYINRGFDDDRAAYWIALELICNGWVAPKDIYPRLRSAYGLSVEDMKKK